MGLDSTARKLMSKEKLWHSIMNSILQGNFMSVPDRDDVLQNSYIKFLKNPVYFYDDIHIGYFKKIIFGTLIDYFRQKKQLKSLDDTLNTYEEDFYYLKNTPDYRANLTKSILLKSLTDIKEEPSKYNYYDLHHHIQRMRKEEKKLIELYMDFNFNLKDLCIAHKKNYYKTYRQLKKIFNNIKLEIQWD